MIYRLFPIFYEIEYVPLLDFYANHCNLEKMFD